jgi:multidrug efflux pump
MSFTDFFIKRPVMATVLNLLILVGGLLAFSSLNLREYPKVSSPVFSIEVSYPNASSEVMESQVATRLEEALGGVEGVDEITSKSRYANTSIQLRFKSGTDMAKAQSGIRDGLAMSRGDLPQDIQEPIVKQQDSDADALMYISLTSTQADFAELTHIANIYLKNPLKTIAGVSKVEVYGQPYEMQIRLDTAKMLQHKIDASQVYKLLGDYNAVLPGGRYQDALPITIDLEASSVKDFEKIPVAHHGNAIVLLKDIADIKLAYSTKEIVRLNGKPVVFLGIVKSSDGNPLDISNAVSEQLPEFKKIVPSHVTIDLGFDRTRFIRGSLAAIKASIFEAIVLVMMIVFLFLRNFRSILIPIVAIPLSLIGVMTIMSMFGLSLNTITLLAMVLAVGLVVDDAIVVLENIHRHIEDGLPPKEAALKGAREIGFAIIAMTLTLASVYAPIAFIQDAIGQVFFEFALTLAGAVIISGIVALTFSPLMCSLLLKPQEKHYLPKLDVWLEKLEVGYQGLLSKVFVWPKLLLASLLIVMLACVGLFQIVPQALTPAEDRGVIGIFMPPLTGVSLTEFDSYIQQVEKLMSKIDEAPGYLTFVTRGHSTVVSLLKPWSERKRSAAQIVEQLRVQVADIPSIQVYPWSWETGIPGVDIASSAGSGLTVVIQTVGTYKYLNQHIEQLNKAFNDDKMHFTSSRHDLKLNSPGFNGKIDRRQLALSGITPQQASLDLAIMADENVGLEFKKDGARYKIALSASEKPFFLEEVFAINNEKEIVPYSDFMTLVPDVMSRELNHYNQLRSANLTVETVPGIGMEEAVKLIEEKIAEVLPSDLRHQFSGVAKKLKESSSMMLMLIMIALLFIFCIMAIQFESFVDPLIIMFTVPRAGFGALGLIWLTGGTLDIYTQVGLVTLIGLISKHGILIVEFANQRLSQGVSVIEAVSQAALLRLRPILMTTGAMVFGALPLIISSGAGAETRRAIGIVLVGGLSVGTLLTLFVIPGLYLYVKSAMGNKS